MPLSNMVNGTLRGRRKARQRRMMNRRGQMEDSGTLQDASIGLSQDSEEINYSNSSSSSRRTSRTMNGSESSLSSFCSGSKRRVSFSAVEVREYAVTHDPYQDAPYALTLDWEHSTTYKERINDGSMDRISGARWMGEVERRQRLEDMGHDSTALDVDAILKAD